MGNIGATGCPFGAAEAAQLREKACKKGQREREREKRRRKSVKTVKEGVGEGVGGVVYVCTEVGRCLKYYEKVILIEPSREAQMYVSQNFPKKDVSIVALSELLITLKELACSGTRYAVFGTPLPPTRISPLLLHLSPSSPTVADATSATLCLDLAFLSTTGFPRGTLSLPVADSLPAVLSVSPKPVRVVA